MRLRWSLRRRRRSSPAPPAVAAIVGRARRGTCGSTEGAPMSEPATCSNSPADRARRRRARDRRDGRCGDLRAARAGRRGRRLRGVDLVPAGRGDVRDARVHAREVRDALALVRRADRVPGARLPQPPARRGRRVARVPDGDRGGGRDGRRLVRGLRRRAARRRTSGRLVVQAVRRGAGRARDLGHGRRAASHRPGADGDRGPAPGRVRRVRRRHAPARRRRAPRAEHLPGRGRHRGQHRADVLRVPRASR